MRRFLKALAPHFKKVKRSLLRLYSNSWFFSTAPSLHEEIREEGVWGRGRGKEKGRRKSEEIRRFLKALAPHLGRCSAHLRSYSIPGSS
jgi:hypothetical protein